MKRVSKTFDDVEEAEEYKCMLEKKHSCNLNMRYKNNELVEVYGEYRTRENDNEV